MNELIFPITKSHNNAAIFSDYKLIDLNKALTDLAVANAGPFKRGSGFYPLSTHTYYDNIYDERLVVGKNNTHALTFNGKNQALIMDLTNDSTVINSQTLAMTFWIRYITPSIELSNDTISRGTIISTRVNPSSGDLTSGDMNNLEAVFDGNSGIGFGIAKYGAVDYRWSLQYNNLTQDSLASIPSIGWKFVVIAKQNDTLVMTVDGLHQVTLPLAGVDKTLSFNKLLVGAAVTGDPTDGSLNAFSYHHFQLSDLTVWNNMDSGFDYYDTRYKTFNPQEYYTKAPSTSSHATFSTESYLSLGMKAVSLHASLSPREGDKLGILDDTNLYRFNAELSSTFKPNAVSLDSAAGVNAVELNGRDNFISVKNRALSRRLDDTLAYAPGDRKQVFFDFNQSFTIDFWIKPDAYYLDYLSTSKVYNISGFYLSVASSLVNFLPINEDELLAGLTLIGTINGFDIAFGSMGGSHDTIAVTAFVRSPYINSGNIVSVTTTFNNPSGYGNDWPWLNVQFVFDVIEKKLKLYLTERTNLVPDDSDEQVITINAKPLINPQDITDEVGPQAKRLSDLYLGARYYSKTDELSDFFKGKLCDLKIHKTSKTLDYLNENRYNSVSDV